MITLQEICTYLNLYLDVSSFADFAVNGIQVEACKTVSHLTTAVTANLAAIKKAKELKANLLLVHHGIFWDRDSYAILGTKRDKLRLLLQHGITLAAYHLPLDAHRTVGNNWRAAIEMGWEQLAPFGELNGKFIGVLGRFPATPVADFQKKLEKYYVHQAHSALGGKKIVESAALISGGGYKMIKEASSRGKVDCFVTGNFDEPAWNHAFEEKINFFALGHSATEKVGIKTLGAHLAEKFGITHTFIDIPNPF